jgi:N-acetylmuramoyl-L-alanine amidase
MGTRWWIVTFKKFISLRALFAAVVCLLAALAPALTVRGEAFPAGAGVRASYARLRNLDASGLQGVYTPRWILLSDQMENVFARVKGPIPARDLLFAADTNFRVYRQTEKLKFLERAGVLAERILNSVGGDREVRGEASLLRGDISVVRREGDRVALGYYEEALSQGASVARIARGRILSINNRTFASRVPSSDLETPRLVKKSSRDAKSTPVKRIVLDPGHGGFDSGAVGWLGQSEKDITLDLARRVKELLEGVPSLSVLLTRDEDTFVPLARRTSYANRRKADAFISIHLNASPSHKLRGLEAYYLDTTDDEASRLLAQRENGIVPGGDMDDLSYILSDLIQSGKLEGSVELAHHVESSVASSARGKHRDIVTHGVKKGPFFVLVGAHMPCSLIELFFIDNPQDGSKLATEEFRTILANGLADGLIRFSLPGEVMQVRSRPYEGKKVRSASAKSAPTSRKRRNRRS